MLRSLKELKGYSIRATDGEIGSIADFYFDDGVWLVRYVVVDTGKWLPGRQVLLSPVSAGTPDWEEKSIPVHLTRNQVEDSPDIETDQPISRQIERQLSSHYGWPVYWGDPFLSQGLAASPLGAAGVGPSVEAPPEETTEQATVTGDPHLRSLSEVLGYQLEATDGEIGKADDFIVDDADWQVRYLVADTGSWLSSRKVVFAVQWVLAIEWKDARIHVDLTRDAIRSSPPFAPSAPVNREYEVRLYDYYGRPSYWGGDKAK